MYTYRKNLQYFGAYCTTTAVSSYDIFSAYMSMSLSSLLLMSEQSTD
jgi:hypothetical protein